ncbi:MAG: DUF309 domain-containing protein [Candidatus Marinimicrobia bacterium]|jgi:predicted metal-dependent hydrolase|nr:DUF309 domain-containing protein [Candidatus Neomarinimicrobiota bacterium]HJM47640.1 DUF309 domain-containing protein [Candidatus Neomarinimicrobiota bacterium]|tara:strand:- start:110 stop:487 length:378 start_codon:yes stop_codon:yes gene_type:complete
MKGLKSKKRKNNQSYLEMFEKGRDLFNQGEIYQAHVTWEHIWKGGDADVRKNIKGFIQLTGGLLNNSYGKKQATEYLLLKAMENIKHTDKLSENLDLESIIKQINQYTTEMRQGVRYRKSVPISL